MKRRALLHLMIVVLGVLNSASAGAQSGRVLRVASVFIGTEEASRGLIEVQRLGLGDLGVREGEHVMIDRFFLNNRVERLPAMYAELGEKPYDVFTGTGHEGIRAAQAAAKGRIVLGYFCGNDVVGMVGSLARPGSNTTGVSCLNEALSLKRVELLREGLPQARRIAYLHNPNDTTRPREIDEVREMAGRLRLSVVLVPLSDASQIKEALAMAKREGADAVAVAEGLFAFANRQAIVDAAVAEKLPGMYFYREFVTAGGTMSYGPNLHERIRELGRQLARIVRGAKAADLPIDQPTRFELVVNRAAARTIGVSISDSLVFRADEVLD